MNELTRLETTDITALGTRVAQHITEHWQKILESERERLSTMFATEGDAAYGVYQNLLFKPIKALLEQAGLKASPSLPGGFQSSREWGNTDETEQQRWMWSTIRNATGEALGTLVNIIHHDHSQFRVPHQPEIIALNETVNAEVEAALSRLSTDFAQALEFTVWYAEYLKTMNISETEENESRA